MSDHRNKFVFWIFLAALFAAVFSGCRTQSTVSVIFNSKTNTIEADAVNAPKDGSGMLDLTLERDGKIIVSVKMKRGSFRVTASSKSGILFDDVFSGIEAIEYPAAAGTFTVTVEAEKTATGTLTVEPVYPRGRDN